MENEKRLIDANALSEKIGNMKFEITHNRGGYQYCSEDEKNEWDKLDVLDNLVCDAPTVDAVEVAHGRWKIVEVDLDDDIKIHRFACSECDCLKNTLIGKYCPNCGAKMDGD